MKRNFTLLILLSLISIIFVSYAGYCDADIEKIKKNLPQLLGANNEGLEFALGVFPAWVEARPPNYVGSPTFRLFIVSEHDVKVKVTIAAKNWTKDYSAKANQLMEVIIPDSIAQMSKKSKDYQVPEPAQVYAGGAIMVTSDVPIVCYGVLRYPYTSDGYLALPVNALGREYVVAGYAGPNSKDGEFGQYLPSYTAIVGAYDSTNVTFTLGGKEGDWIPTSDNDTLTAGESMTKTLNKGDIWLIPARGPYPDVTGSHVLSDKPVASFSGNFCSYVPVTKGYCDYIIEQDIPTYTWGSKYYVTPIIKRLKRPVIRVFATKDSTVIYRNGWYEQICTIPKRYGPENEGWIELRKEEGAPLTTTLLSNNRFNVVQYNPGQDDDGVSSDPFSMAVIPVEQFQDHIMFTTPGDKDGLHYKENYVNLVYQATKNNRIPDDLEIGIVNSLDELVWTDIAMKFDAAPGEEIIDPTNPNPERRFYCKQIKLPEDGTYHIRANDKFGAYLYGFSPWDSYGFPASTQSFDLERPDTVRPIFEYTIDSKGYVPDRSLASKRPAYVKDMPDDSAFRSNMSLIYFDKDNSYNYIFEHKPFVPGDDRYVEWSLTPVNPKLDSRAVITFTDRAGNDTTLIIQHWSTRLDITPHVKDFGKLKTGESRSFPFKVTNKSTAAYTMLDSLKLQKGDQGFKLSYTFDPHIPIAPGESRDFTVTFTAPGEGEFSDSIGVGDACCFEYISNIQAGVGTPKITVSDVAFPKTSVTDERGPIKAIIKNTGNTQLVITRLSEPKNSAFRTDLADFGISEDNPVFLSANKELAFNVWFKPDAATAYLDSIIVSSDASEIDSVCVITGESVNPIIRVSDATFKNTTFNEGKDSATITVANTGANDLTITGYSDLHEGVFTTNLTDFSISPSNPKILQPGGEFQFIAWFAPTDNKIYQDSIVFVSDAVQQDPVCRLTGEGVKGISENNLSNDACAVQVLPNPLDSRGGQLEFENPVDGNVEIVLFNSLNQQVAVLQSGWLKAGKQSIRIPVETHPSGAYTFRIVAGKNAAVGNFVINK